MYTIYNMFSFDKILAGKCRTPGNRIMAWHLEDKKIS